MGELYGRPISTAELSAPEGDPHRASRAGRGDGNRRRTRRYWVLPAIAILVLGFFTASGVLFVWPATDQPRHVDAIVSLNGTDEAGRENLAISLAEKGYAGVLLFSEGPGPLPDGRSGQGGLFLASSGEDDRRGSFCRRLRQATPLAQSNDRVWPSPGNTCPVTYETLFCRSDYRCSGTLPVTPLPI